MLKMMLDGTGEDGNPKKLVVFGLSHVNLERLRAGRAIGFSGDEIGLPGVEFRIFAGETEQSMARELHELIGPETSVKIDPRLRD